MSLQGKEGAASSSPSKKKNSLAAKTQRKDHGKGGRGWGGERGTFCFRKERKTKKKIRVASSNKEKKRAAGRLKKKKGHARQSWGKVKTLPAGTKGYWIWAQKGERHQRPKRIVTFDGDGRKEGSTGGQSKRRVGVTYT